LPGSFSIALNLATAGTYCDPLDWTIVKGFSDVEKRVRISIEAGTEFGELLLTWTLQIKTSQRISKSFSYKLDTNASGGAVNL
jgi:hypothetical protein